MVMMMAMMMKETMATGLAASRGEWTHSDAVGDEDQQDLQRREVRHRAAKAATARCMVVGSDA